MFFAIGFLIFAILFAIIGYYYKEKYYNFEMFNNF